MCKFSQVFMLRSVCHGGCVCCICCWTLQNLYLNTHVCSFHYFPNTTSLIPKEFSNFFYGVRSVLANIVYIHLSWLIYYLIFSASLSWFQWYTIFIENTILIYNKSHCNHGSSPKRIHLVLSSVYIMIYKANCQLIEWQKSTSSITSSFPIDDCWLLIEHTKLIICLSMIWWYKIEDEEDMYLCDFLSVQGCHKSCSHPTSSLSSCNGF